MRLRVVGALLCVAAFFFVTGSALAQSADRPALPSAHWLDDFEFLPEGRFRNGVFYFPYLKHMLNEDSTIPIHLVGIAYENFAAGTFINSYDDRTVFVVRNIGLVSYGRAGLDLQIGAMYGYHGRLGGHDNLPAAFRFLFDGEINPLAAFSPYLAITETVELRALVSPMFVTGGLKVNF